PSPDLVRREPLGLPVVPFQEIGIGFRTRVPRERRRVPGTRERARQHEREVVRREYRGKGARGRLTRVGERYVGQPGVATLLPPLGRAVPHDPYFRESDLGFHPRILPPIRGGLAMRLRTTRCVVQR